MYERLSNGVSTSNGMENGVTEQQACDNIVPFLKQMKGKYLNVTIVRETRFEAAQ